MTFFSLRPFLLAGVCVCIQCVWGGGMGAVRVFVYVVANGYVGVGIARVYVGGRGKWWC